MRGTYIPVEDRHDVGKISRFRAVDAFLFSTATVDCHEGGDHTESAHAACSCVSLFRFLLCPWTRPCHMTRIKGVSFAGRAREPILRLFSLRSEGNSHLYQGQIVMTS